MYDRYQNIKGKGNRFSSTNQPANRGRKPKLYTIAQKAYKITFDEYKETVLHLIQCTRTEIEETSKANDTPIWVVNICRALLHDAGKGVMNALHDLTALMWGKEMAQKIDVTTNGKDIGTQLVFSPTPLTEKDIQEIKDIQNGAKKDSNDSSISEA